MKNNSLILVTEEMVLETADHFEYTESEGVGMTPSRFASVNHADTGLGKANESVSGAIGGAFGSLIGNQQAGTDSGKKTGGAIGDFVGKLFGGGSKEDTSLTGWNAFKSSFAGLPFYPTKAEMLNAAQVGKWDPAEPAAIQASYDPNSGTWVRGDWRFQVIGTAPITVKDFKGANETHTFSAPVNAKVNTSVIGNAVGSLFGAPVSQGQPQMGNPQVNASAAPATVSQGTPAVVQQVNPQLTPTQQAIVQGLGLVSDYQARQALAAQGHPVAANQQIYAASAGGFAGNLFGGMSSNMTAAVILGVLALVALMIWFANR